MRERILAMVSRTMDVPVQNLSEESSPATVESWDSLKHMNLILAIEEEFGIRFTDDQIMSMNTVGAITGTVSRLARP